MKGLVLGTGVTQNADCPGIPYTLVVPDRTTANLALFARTLNRWTHRQIDFYDMWERHELTEDVVDRAQFTLGVLDTLMTNLAVGVCCAVVAVDPDDDILGALDYMLLPDTKTPGAPMMGLINLLAVDPANIPGSPVVVQMRGVGTALVAAVATRFLKAKVSSVELHPLDADAERFWRARGFMTCRPGGFLCVRGDVQLRAMIAACDQKPDNACDGDCIHCGIPKKIRERLGRR